MHWADNLTTFMYQLSWNLGTSTSWNPQGLSRPIMGLLYFEIYIYILGLLMLTTQWLCETHCMPSRIWLPTQYFLCYCKKITENFDPNGWFQDLFSVLTEFWPQFYIPLPEQQWQCLHVQLASFQRVQICFTAILLTSISFNLLAPEFYI
jgi:hypothetical protein